jgi:acyl-CoA thioester hydrolase
MNENNTDRDDYYYFSTITTRWMDNDIYGHVNNVTYYSYFDTVANQYLIEEGGLDIQTAEIVGFVVASNCNYLSPIAHPELLSIGFRVNKLGNSSVEYGIGIFCEGEQKAAAYGTFTHVFVNRASNKSAPIPTTIREALEAALIKE